MTKLSVDVSLDDLFEQSGAPAIVGPDRDTESEAWVVYLPGEVPCICDSFEDAADMMREHLAKTAQRRRSRTK